MELLIDKEYVKASHRLVDRGKDFAELFPTIKKMTPLLRNVPSALALCLRTEWTGFMSKQKPFFAKLSGNKFDEYRLCPPP